MMTLGWSDHRSQPDPKTWP